MLDLYQQIELPLCPVLYSMEKAGVAIDRKQLEEFGIFAAARGSRGKGRKRDEIGTRSFAANVQVLGRLMIILKQHTDDSFLRLLFYAYYTLRRFDGQGINHEFSFFNRKNRQEQMLLPVYCFLAETYFIIFSTSSAKLSSRFSRPSPHS